MLGITRTNQQANTELKRIVETWARRYDELCEESFNAAVAKAKVGSYIPPKGQLIGQEYKDMFDAESYRVREQAFAIVDERIDFVKSLMTGAPTSEQTNTISLLAIRTDISKDEFLLLAKEYSDYYQTYMALCDVAKKHDVHLPAHKRAKELEALETLRETLGKLSRFGIGEGYQRTIIKVVLNDYIDSAFPVD